MYIKKSRAIIKGKTYEYLRLVQGIRVGTKIKHKVVAYLGRIDDPSSAASFLFNKSPVKNRQQARLYALPMACNQIIEQVLNLPAILAKVFSTVPKETFLLIKLMILSRLLNPESKLSLTRWYQHLYLPDYLPKKIDVHQFYTALDNLMVKKEEIEKALFTRMREQGLIDATIVFYDLTSSYFEGEECEIAKFGHSRDKRQDCLQITIGLVIDQSGLPIFHEVFAGNMSDRKTVKGILDKVKNILSIKNILFVADKGMLSPDNIAELEKLKTDGYTYILSQSPRAGYDTLKSFLAQKDTWKKLTEALHYTVTAGLILCYNPFTAQKAKTTRDAKIEKLTTFISSELAKTEAKRKQDKQIIHDRIIKKLHSCHASKYFTKDTFQKRETVILKEELLDGVWVLTGNTKLTPEEIIEAYKQEATIESSFRVIKDVVELRPIYHYSSQRVKAHVFICVISYLVARLLERKTGQTIKALKEKYMASVIMDGDTPSSPKQIIGESIEF
jgi:transposase